MNPSLPQDLHPDTLAVRQALPRSVYGEHSEALYLTSSFVQPDAETAARRFAGEEDGYTYTRTSNPTVTSFERRLAAMDALHRAGVPVGLGVDGSASNDSSHMLGEVRQSLLLQRVGFGPDAMTARQALEIATRGGARVLNRDDIGHLAPGMAADLVAFDLSGIGFAGGLHDPVAALVFNAVPSVAFAVVNGRVVARDGQLTTLDLGPLIERHNRLARTLVNG